MEYFIDVKESVPIEIFKQTPVKEELERLFNKKQERIKARIDEVKEYLGTFECDKLSYENITELFKVYYYKEITSKTIQKVYSCSGEYHIIRAMLSELTEESLEKAIMGKPMIDSFNKALSMIDSTDALHATLKGSKMLLLEKHFLGKEVYSLKGVNKENKKEPIDMQENLCAECGCNCTCDMACIGDTKKCTSNVALEKGCNHHCECYMDALLKGISKRVKK